MINWQKIWQHFLWKNGSVTALSAENFQKLNDAIKLLDERIVELAGKAVTRDEIVNNLLATEPNTVLAATMGKALDDKIKQVNSNLTSHRGFVTGDFDNYVTPGTWDYGGSGATHAPTSEGGKLRVKPGYYITQEYMAESQDYSRIKLESGWSSWRRGITNTDIAEKFKNIRNVSLNSINTTVFGYASNCTDTPGGNGYLICVSGGGMCWQRFIVYQTGIVHERQLLADGKTWTVWDRLLSNTDLDGRLVRNASTTALQSPFAGTNSARLQIGSDGGVSIWKTTDGGKNWSIVKTL